MIEFNDLHILIIDGKPGNAKTLRSILIALRVSNITCAQDTSAAADALCIDCFHAILLDDGIGPMSAVEFVKALRKGSSLRNQRAPVILLTDRPRRKEVELARDAGMNGLLVRPLSINAVKQKIASLILAPKPFVVTDEFAGPDRRRHRERRNLSQEESSRYARKKVRRKADQATVLLD